jgi:hypothetical protein
VHPLRRPRNVAISRQFRIDSRNQDAAAGDIDAVRASARQGVPIVQILSRRPLIPRPLGEKKVEFPIWRTGDEPSAKRANVYNFFDGLPFGDMFGAEGLGKEGAIRSACLVLAKGRFSSPAADGTHGGTIRMRGSRAS